MRRRLIVGLVLVLIILPLSSVQAQSPEYRLNRPSAEEYLSALPGIVAQARQDDTSKYKDDSSNLSQVATFDLQTNYPDLSSIRLSTLLGAEPALSLSPYPGGPYTEEWWQHLVVNAWLRETRIDPAQRQVHFGDYSIDLTPVDFNGDGTPELVADIDYEPGALAAYTELVALQQNPSAPGRYTRVKSPGLAYVDCGVHSPCGGGAQTFKLGDITGDGLPEWLVASHMCGYGECGGWLTVFGWRDGELVDLVAHGQASDPFFWTGPSTTGGGPELPPDGTWTFQMAPAGQHLIVQSYTFHDNRDCEVTYTTPVTWDSHWDRFIPGDVVTSMPGTAACALRGGHANMLAGNYVAATANYSRALDLFPPGGDAATREAAQYARVRLMLAHALAHEPAQALSVRDTLKTQKAENPLMGSLLDDAQVYSGDGDRIRLCTAIYETIAGYNPYGDAQGSHIWDFGRTDDVQDRPMNYSGGDFGPDATGCDLRQVLDETIGGLDLTTNHSPVDALAGAGVRTVRQLSADLNRDGQPDWLLWIDGLPDQALAFYSSRAHFRFDQERIARPGSQNQLTTMSLPGGGEALVGLQFGGLTDWGDVSQPCGKDQPFGSLSLWRLGSRGLSGLGAYLLCQPRTLAQIFPSPTGLHAWQYSWSAATQTGEVVFVWNAARGTYEQPEVVEPVASRAQEDCTNLPYHYCGFEGSLSSALPLCNATLADPPQDATPGFLAAVRYRRALAMEGLGNTRAALADYVYLYENAPNSAWKQLVALHLKPVKAS